MSKEKKLNEKAIILSLAKDLVETAVQVKKVLAVCSVPYSHIEEARLLGLMAEEIINSYTKNKEEGKDEATEKVG